MIVSSDEVVAKVVFEKARSRYLFSFETTQQAAF